MFRSRDNLGNPKYAGRSKARVIDNRDPLQRGRIRVSHPLLGQTSWIDYLREPGQFSVPSIGDVVYVEAEAGVPEYPVASGNLITGNDSNPNLPNTFKRDIPTNRGLFTPGGHFIEFDDGEATLTTEPNDTKFTDKNKGIRITSSTGNKIHISEENKYILIEDANGNSIKLDYESDNLNIEVNGKVIVKASETTIDAPTNTITGKLEVQGDVTAKANEKIDGNLDVGGNVNVTGNSSLGGGTPLVLSTAQFIGVGNRGSPVISSIMSGMTTKSTSS